MFITRKKFKRKDGIRTFYYVVKNIKIENKHRIKNVRYLGTVDNILEKFRIAEKYTKKN